MGRCDVECDNDGVPSEVSIFMGGNCVFHLFAMVFGVKYCYLNLLDYARA